MFGRQKRKGIPKDSGFFSVLELGASSIQALVVEYRSGYGLVQGWGKAPSVPRFYLQADLTSLAQMVGYGEEALTRAEDMTERTLGKKVVPDWVVVGVPGPWVKGFSCTVQRRRRKSQEPVTVEEMEEVLGRTQRLALLQISREMRLTEEEICLLDTQVVELLLEGNKVSDPFVFSSPTLSITIGNTFAPTASIEALLEIIRELKLEPMGLVAQPQALAEGLNGQDGVYLALGEQGTDIAVAREGKPFSQAHLPRGTQDLAQGLAGQLGLGLESAEKLLLDYSSGWVGQETKEAVEGAMDMPARSWLEAVAKELKSIRELDVLPAHVYLCGGGSLLPVVEVEAAMFPWMGRLPFRRRPQVALLHPHQVHGVSDRTGALHTPRETVVTSLASWGVEAGRGKSSQRLREVLQRVSARTMNSLVLSVGERG